MKEERQRKGLNRAELARKAGLTSQSVSAWERTLDSDVKSRGATLDTAVAIADALGVSLDKLCGRECEQEQSYKLKTAYDVVVLLEELERVCDASVKLEKAFPQEFFDYFTAEQLEQFPEGAKEVMESDSAGVHVFLSSGQIEEYYNTRNTLKELVEKGYMTPEMYQTCVDANLQKLKQTVFDEG
jgi:transcriptional regulator with XRE-family HTH domain